jgi:hypothetical protein
MNTQYAFHSLTSHQSFSLGCAITGLVFYQELEDDEEEEAKYLFPEQYRNKLFFGDYCKGWIRMIDINGNLTFKTLNLSNSDTYAPAFVKGTAGGLSMTQGHDGSLYFSERGTWWGAYTTNMGVLTGMRLVVLNLYGFCLRCI